MKLEVVRPVSKVYIFELRNCFIILPEIGLINVVVHDGGKCTKTIVAFKEMSFLVHTYMVVH